MRLLNGSGCLDALVAPNVARSLDTFVTKTVTPLPREGNPPVRIAETDIGMLNSIGLANPGIDAFVSDTLPRLGELGIPIWVSVGGFSEADYANLCAALDNRPEVEAIELNLSCPNVDEPVESAGELVMAARQATAKPLYAKLSPAVPSIAALAVEVKEAGAEGLTLVNTIRGLSLDARTLRPTLAPQVGGLSGPALKPIALAAVFSAYRETGLPIVGLGGVSTGRDALDLLAAGAISVALGTVLFSDPDAPARIRSELEQELESLAVAEADNIHGRAHGGSLCDWLTLDRNLSV